MGPRPTNRPCICTYFLWIVCIMYCMYSIDINDVYAAQPKISNTMKLLFPLLLQSTATIHGLQVVQLRSNHQRFGLSPQKAVSRRSVANESTQDDDYDIDGSISSWKRLVSSLPQVSRKGGIDELDAKILSTCIPTMLNLMVVPIVNAVDTFYVGRLRSPLALAAQSAANQCFFTV